MNYSAQLRAASEAAHTPTPWKRRIGQFENFIDGPNGEAIGTVAGLLQDRDAAFIVRQ